MDSSLVASGSVEAIVVIVIARSRSGMEVGVEVGVADVKRDADVTHVKNSSGASSDAVRGMVFSNVGLILLQC